MTSYSYISCPYCSFLFKFTNEKLEDDNSILLKCPSCNQEFGITEGPPLDVNNMIESPVNLLGAITLPVDATPLFSDIGLPVIDVKSSRDSDVDS